MPPSSERRQINGAWVKALRKAQGLSQRVFAERVGVSLPTVARWELDTFRPSLLAARLLREFADKRRDEPGVLEGGQDSPLTRLKRRRPQPSHGSNSHAASNAKSSKGRKRKNP